jgi:hypothetical protein
MSSGKGSQKGGAKDKQYQYRTNQRRQEMKITTTVICQECFRVFDLLDEKDAEEWSYGHDCEETPEE